MKINKKIKYAKLFLLLSGIFTSAVSLAQDVANATTTTTSTSVTTEKTWYMEPWAWILSGVVLLVIIILATRSSSSKKNAESVTITRTVQRETDAG